MIKLTVLYNTPADKEKFNNYYFGTHVPLAMKLPNMVKAEVSLVSGSLDGGTPPYHLIAELYYPDQAALMASLGSPEGQATAGDVANFAQAGVTMLVSEVAEG